MQAANRVEDLASALRVEHGGRLIKNQKLRVHRQHTRQRDALLLPAGEHVRRAALKARHADGGKRGRDLFGNAVLALGVVLQAKSDVLGDDGGDELVVRALEHHPDPAA